MKKIQVFNVNVKTPSQGILTFENVDEIYVGSDGYLYVHVFNKETRTNIDWISYEVS